MNSTVYHNLTTLLKDQGFTEVQAAELFIKIVNQVELEVLEKIILDLPPEKTKILGTISKSAKVDEVAQKLELETEYVDKIRAEKLAKVLKEVLPEKP